MLSVIKSTCYSENTASSTKCDVILSLITKSLEYSERLSQTISMETVNNNYSVRFHVHVKQRFPLKFHKSVNIIDFNWLCKWLSRNDHAGLIEIQSCLLWRSRCEILNFDIIIYYMSLAFKQNQIKYIIKQINKNKCIFNIYEV